jgi:hypothetical protein
MKRPMRAALAMLAMVPLAGGCATRSLVSHPGDGVHLAVEPQEYKVIGAVQGKDCVPRILAFRFTNPDLLKAEVKALGAVSGAEILLNKHVYGQDETVIPILFGNTCFYVEGLAVDLK